jgi:hypothetical protein
LYFEAPKRSKGYISNYAEESSPFDIFAAGGRKATLATDATKTYYGVAFVAFVAIIHTK